MELFRGNVGRVFFETGRYGCFLVCGQEACRFEGEREEDEDERRSENIHQSDDEEHDPPAGEGERCWCVLRAKGDQSADYLADADAAVPEAEAGGGFASGVPEACVHCKRGGCLLAFILHLLLDRHTDNCLCYAEEDA